MKDLKRRRKSRKWFYRHPWKWMGRRSELPPRDQRKVSGNP